MGTSFFQYPLKDIPLILLVVAISLSVHEFAHAYVAYKFGDDTAKRQGRLTLSPFKHLDIFGTLAIIILGFGWARPVPVNRHNFKNPRIAGILTTAAGPISNLILATFGLIIYLLLLKFGFFNSFPQALSITLDSFFSIFIQLNIVLFVFNLIPLPPLDGYRIIEDLVPNDLRAKMSQYEQYGAFVFLILVLTPLDNFTIQPIFQVAIPSVFHWISSIVAPLIM
ncbi:site-2 protease family protein [Gottfriedia luciferensis]|uniref:site-2 protease family protein n=1 Tax=Gottfriedia luciferensis TaxID=178774 RepID=UPI000B43A4DA|nr:site-2 protease family protein [Gottfriedia luciferensis]